MGMTTCSCTSVGNCNCTPGQCNCKSCHNGADKNAQASSSACSCVAKDSEGSVTSCSCTSKADCKCGDSCTCASCGKDSRRTRPVARARKSASARPIVLAATLASAPTALRRRRSESPSVHTLRSQSTLLPELAPIRADFDVALLCSNFCACSSSSSFFHPVNETLVDLRIVHI